MHREDVIAFIMFPIILYVLSALLLSYLAGRRNRNGLSWGLIGGLALVPSVILLYILPPIRLEADASQDEKSNSNKGEAAPRPTAPAEPSRTAATSAGNTSKFKAFLPEQIKGLVILYNEPITSSNADAVNAFVNDLLPLPLPPIGLIREENVDIHNVASCIARMHKGMRSLGFNPPDPKKVVEEVINIPGYSIKGRIYACVER
jgi:hypothetical protein